MPPQGQSPALLVLGRQVSVERSPEFLPHPSDHFGGFPRCPHLTWRPEPLLFFPPALRCPQRATILLFYTPWFRLSSQLPPASQSLWSSSLPRACSIQRGRGRPPSVGLGTLGLPTEDSSVGIGSHSAAGLLLDSDGDVLCLRAPVVSGAAPDTGTSSLPSPSRLLFCVRILCFGFARASVCSFHAFHLRLFLSWAGSCPQILMLKL